MERWIARGALGRWCLVDIEPGDGYGGSGARRRWTVLAVPGGARAASVAALLRLAAGGVDCRGLGR